MSSLTSLTGYAGGTELNAKGHACYEGYGRLGHTEVVVMTIPSSRFGEMLCLISRASRAARKVRQGKLSDFAVVFWDLFVGNGGIDRVDIMDIGPEYRAAIGVPGGFTSEYVQVVNQSQSGRAARYGFWFELKEGAGNDPDTLGQVGVLRFLNYGRPCHRNSVKEQRSRISVEILSTCAPPAPRLGLRYREVPLLPGWDGFQARRRSPSGEAEVYHQFHDDFLPGGNYPASYNACPEILGPL